MSQTIEDRTHDHDVEPSEVAGSAHRESHRVAWVIAAVVIGALAVAGVRMITTDSTTTSGSFANGSSVDVVLRCTGSSCIAGTTGPDGAQWSWITTSGSNIPSTWLMDETAGSITIDGEWGNATFQANGQQLVLLGGKATPEHTFFG